MEKPPESYREGAPITEGEAVEIFKSDRLVSAEEQERLVLCISDPDISIEVLMLRETHGRIFSVSEQEHLATNIESDQEAVYVFFMNVVEAGILGELNETERWLVDRLRESALQIEDPSAVAYIRENFFQRLPEENSKG